MLSHGPQAPWQLGMFALGANMRESLTCCHDNLGKMDQKDQVLAALIHESHGSMAQEDLMDQSLIHEIRGIHAKRSEVYRRLHGAALTVLHGQFPIVLLDTDTSYT
jgi:hypothetical protein